MSMETFDFPIHTESTVYNDQDRNLKMGGGWDYQVEPVINDPRTFVLTFDALKWITKTEANGQLVVDVHQEYNVNAGRLDKFYAVHRLYKPFWYQHPKYGMVKVRFEKPLALPSPVKNSGGVVQNVAVHLIEIQ